jgi:hypothetical protein
MPIATAAATAAVLFVAFTLNREQATRPQPAAVAPGVQAGSEATERVRLAAIGDHLERSERLLLDIVNARGQVDVTVQQAWAAELVESNRIYRYAADTAGEPIVVDVLDDLERSLLDVAHAPAHLTGSDLDRLRQRVESSDLLFKVRVMSDALHEREGERASSLTKDSI